MQQDALKATVSVAPKIQNLFRFDNDDDFGIVSSTSFYCYLGIYMEMRRYTKAAITYEIPFALK